MLRPRLDKKDWARVKSLWINALKARADDPEEVARVVTSLAYYGPEHPYGHPQEGTISSAQKVELADVARWHRAIFRPAKANIVVAGDVQRDRITQLLGRRSRGGPSPPLDRS